MKAAYPRIDEALDFLTNEFGLTELKWNNPIKPESKTFRDYTIYCFPEYDPNNNEKSFGGAICRLNDAIWWWFTPNKAYPHNTNRFIEALSMLFGTIPDLKGEFKERVRGRTPEIYFDNVHYNESLIADARKMHIEKGYIERCNEPLLDILDENLPHLFLNMLELSEVRENYIDFSSKW